MQHFCLQSSVALKQILGKLWLQMKPVEVTSAMTQLPKASTTWAFLTVRCGKEGQYRL